MTPRLVFWQHVWQQVSNPEISLHLTGYILEKHEFIELLKEKEMVQERKSKDGDITAQQNIRLRSQLSRLHALIPFPLSYGLSHRAGPAQLFLALGGTTLCAISLDATSLNL
ncbi:unnamed protein product [Urochloa humidicola]